MYKIPHSVYNYTLCVKLHTVCQITHCVSNYTLRNYTWGPFVDTFRVNCQKIPLTWKNFPQTPFAAFVTNMRYVYSLILLTCWLTLTFSQNILCPLTFELIWILWKRHLRPQWGNVRSTQITCECCEEKTIFSWN